MASTAGFPLSLHQDELSILLLSDSEDEDAPTTPRDTLHAREPSRADSMEQHEEEAARKKTKDAAANVPLHPIPAMQSAFAESLIEATAIPTVQKPKLRFGDAKERRARLIDADKDAKLHADIWRYRPGQSHHEIWKLMAQIAFGVYLLLNGIANSNIQVVNILQGHIDEVDEFLEVTMEDVKLALEDIQERIDFLKLPMQNVATFEKMLEDRAFRLQIVTGNEKIEHIVNRTALALKANVTDIEEGLKSTKEFAVYLGDQQHRPWRTTRPDVVDIFDAMKRNAEGWYKAFSDLRERAVALDNLLIKLGQMVADMDRRAGEVSRRTRVSPMSSAYELSIRASALMPLQFSVAPFSGLTADASRTSVISPQTSRTSVLSPQASRTSVLSPQHSRASMRSAPVTSPQASTKSSQRSSSSRAHSGSFSSRPESGALGTRSPSQNSPPSSPTARDTLPDFQYKPMQRRSSVPKRAPVLEIDTGSDVTDDPTEASRPSPIEEEGLYILQPRTYTPQPPAPLPSPMVRDPPEPKPLSPPPTQQQAEVPRRTSLRQRLSLKGSHPPDFIQVPPRSSKRPVHQSPRVQIAEQAQVPDSAYGSDVDVRPPFHSVADHLADLSPPVFPHTIPSPRSDQQYFRPVQASPHSPLQRPWTAAPAAIPRPHTSATQYAGHQRNAPSAMGMSMLSNVTTMRSENKTLKKKRSAFGWLKKAFALDEDERAAFEARKLQQQTANPYYEGRSPKFIDGKRREDFRRY
ncbi:uncharacterized protein JN550_004827 [Neoarthrinium moseri]|uniref:uncharacterized protein n=1 Tax=Neoarthrinium moseri TaxID=1658444 RepID=UPI001FDBDBBE|nr:uncharacterized protein JN550_004827 [Neoarthrinium moseri]KAI1870681.1 hypothetical protein JN550_004827 [Neoarthrinium moseri]